MEKNIYNDELVIDLDKFYIEMQQSKYVQQLNEARRIKEGYSLMQENKDLKLEIENITKKYESVNASWDFSRNKNYMLTEENKRLRMELNDSNVKIYDLRDKYGELHIKYDKEKEYSRGQSIIIFAMVVAFLVLYVLGFNPSTIPNWFN